MPKDLPSFIAQEGAKREGSVIREKNFIDANNYETIAYLKHLDVRNEPKMVLFENVPALNGQKSELRVAHNRSERRTVGSRRRPWLTAWNSSRTTLPTSPTSPDWWSSRKHLDSLFPVAPLGRPV